MSAAQLQLTALTPSGSGWVTADQAMQITGWSRTWFFAQVQTGRVISREGDQRAANGRPTRLYLAASLPTRHALELVRPSIQVPLPLFDEAPKIPELRVALPDPAAQKLAEQRLAIIRPILEYDADPEKWSACQLADESLVSSKTQLVRYIAEISQPRVSERTIWGWYRAVTNGGPKALAKKLRADKGQSRWFSLHPKARILAAYLYLGDIDRKDLLPNEKPHRPQSVAFVCEQIRERADSLGIAAGDLPSRETVRSFLSQAISPAMKVLAREGKREYHERMSPFLRRRYDDIYANQVWVGDQMWHDAEVANDIFDDVPLGTPLRLRLDAFEDFRSRKIVGATWTHFGSSRSIAATLRRAILQYGPPEMIYVDNGKDYKKIAKGAQKGFPAEDRRVQDLRPEDVAPIEQTGFLARIGAGVVHCIPRHPQSKGVERCFGTVHHFDAFFSTYTSGSTATRPESTGDAMMEHRRLFKKGRVAESKHPLASTFILACLSWIDKYNATPHSGEGMDGRSPNEVFAAEFNPNQKPTPPPETLALLMVEYERRQVRECAVTLNKRRYTAQSEDRLAWAAMHEANEREILVVYDPADPEYAAALDLDGRFIAWLEAEVLVRFAPNDPATQSQIGKSMEIRRGLEKATKTTLRSIARAARSGGAQSAEEMAYSNIQIPVTTAPIISQRGQGRPNNNEPTNELIPGQGADRLAERLRRNSVNSR
jgi:hypothetical protein